MSASLSTERPVATSQELLRSALQRSGQRNASVARRRLWVRWILWGLGRTARYLSVPALLVAGLSMWSDKWPPSQFADSHLPPPDIHVQPAATEPAASASTAQHSREDLALPSLQLRLDAELPLKRRVPQAQSRKPVAQEKALANPTQQETP